MIQTFERLLPLSRLVYLFIETFPFFMDFKRKFIPVFTYYHDKIIHFRHTDTTQLFQIV